MRSLVLFLLLTSLCGAQTPEPIQLRLASVPMDLSVRVEGSEQPLAYNYKTRTYQLPGSLLPEQGPVKLELSKPGFADKMVEVEAEDLRAEPAAGLVRLPLDLREVYFLDPVTRSITFRTQPPATVFLLLANGQTEPLGESGEILEINFGALLKGSASRDSLDFVFRAPGYRQLGQRLSVKELEALERWPAEGTARLQAGVPVAGPIVYWLSHHRPAALLLGLLALGTIAWLMVLIRRSTR